MKSGMEKNVSANKDFNTSMEYARPCVVTMKNMMVKNVFVPMDFTSSMVNAEFAQVTNNIILTKENA